MCNPLRDDGLSYGDYLEQLTYLIFLKMSDEYARPPYKKESGIPAGYTWQDMNTLTGADLEEQYKDTLEKLGEQGGILGQIFKGAINKVSNAAILYRIVQMIDREKWVSMSSDVKGEIYEGLLQKNAEDVKSGAGQYFTPRALIQAMVACIRPEPMKTIAEKTLTTLIQGNVSFKSGRKNRHRPPPAHNARKRPYYKGFYSSAISFGGAVNALFLFFSCVYLECRSKSTYPPSALIRGIIESYSK